MRTSGGYNAAVSTKKIAVKSEPAAPRYIGAIRIVIAALLAIAGVYALIFVNGEASRTMAFRAALPILCAVSAALLIGALVWFFIAKSRKTDVAGYYFTPAMAVGITATAFAALAVHYVDKYIAYMHGINMKVIFAIIAVAALYLIFSVYSRPFFAFSVYTAAAAMFCLFAYSALGMSATIYAVVMIAAAVAAAVVVMLVKHLTMLDRLAFLSISAVLAVFALLSFAVAGVIIYALYALLAALLVFTIINTIKMI